MSLATALLAQTGGLGSPLVVLLFPILFAILIGGPLAAVAGVILVVVGWRTGRARLTRLARWLGAVAFASNVAFIAYLLVMLPDRALVPPFEWPAVFAMVVGWLALALGTVAAFRASEPGGRGAALAWTALALLLGAAGVGVEIVSVRRHTVEDLLHAAQYGEEAPVRAALARGLSAEMKSRMLGEAFSTWPGAQPAIIELLLAGGADPRTDWPRALSHGDPRIVAAFLAHGADPNASWKGRTAATIAWSAGHEDVVALLGRAGARDADFPQDKFLALVDAARAGDLQRIESLRAEGPWYYSAKVGNAVLLAAAEAGQVRVLELFVSTNGRYDCAALGEPLMAAARAGHEKVVSFLLRRTCVDASAAAAARTAAEQAGHLQIVDLIARQAPK